MPSRTYPTRPSAPDTASGRMPQIFRPPTKTSFGQWMRAATRAASSSASATARAAATVPSGAPACASRASTAWVESTVSKAWMAQSVRRGTALLEGGQARGQLLVDLMLLGQPTPLSRHDIRRRPLDELGAPELALEKLDLLVR